MSRAAMALAVAALALIVPTAALAGESSGDVIEVGNAKVKMPTTSPVAGVKGATAARESRLLRPRARRSARRSSGR